MTALALLRGAWGLAVKHWRTALAVALTLLVLAAWAYTTHLRHIAQAQKQKAAQAVRQAQIQTAATKAVDQVAIKTQAVEEHTRVVVRTIQAAPGSDTPVPAELLSAWRAGLSDDAADPTY